MTSQNISITVTIDREAIDAAIAEYRAQNPNPSDAVLKDWVKKEVLKYSNVERTDPNA